MIDNIVKENIEEYNKEDSSIINNTTYYKYINNNNYINIIYILIKKEYTYYGELRKLLGFTINHHLGKLEENNIIEEIGLTNEIKDFIKTTKNIGDRHFKELKLFSLTQKAKSFYMQDNILNTILLLSRTDKIDRYISEQHMKYGKVKSKQQHEQELSKAKEEHMNKIREIQEKNGIWNY